MSYPESKLTGLTGFALAAKVTGGWTGPVVSITTLDQLKANIGDTTPRVLVINSNISASSLTKVNMGANKTLIGSFQNRTLENIHLRATAQSQNIILQNIVFKHSANIKQNDDIQVYLNYGSQYWIDHCSFVGHSWSTSDGSADKLLYIGEKADYATISNCFFGNHKYGLIFGHPADDNDKAFNGYPRLTLCHNRFDNLEVRAPGLMSITTTSTTSTSVLPWRRTQIFFLKVITLAKAAKTKACWMTKELGPSLIQTVCPLSPIRSRRKRNGRHCPTMAIP